MRKLVQIKNYLLVALLVLVLDRITKNLAYWYLANLDSLAVLPGFSLTLVLNKGAAFGMFSHYAGWQRWFLSAVSVAGVLFMISWLMMLPRDKKALGYFVALTLGGAIGNLWDRALYGSVIDFLDFHVYQYAWPAFNVADTAIVVGGVLTMCHWWQLAD